MCGKASCCCCGFGICCGFSVCCCCITCIVLGGTAYVFGPLLVAGGEVAVCIKGKFSSSHAKFSLQKGPCADVKKYDCKLKNNTAICTKLGLQCSCMIDEHLDSLHDPNLDDGLEKCCKQLENVEKMTAKRAPNFNVSKTLSEFTHTSGSPVHQCRVVAANLSKEVKEFADICKKGKQCLKMISATTKVTGTCGAGKLKGMKPKDCFAAMLGLSHHTQCATTVYDMANKLPGEISECQGLHLQNIDTVDKFSLTGRIGSGAAVDRAPFAFLGAMTLLGVGAMMVRARQPSARCCIGMTSPEPDVQYAPTWADENVEVGNVQPRHISRAFVREGVLE